MKNKYRIMGDMDKTFEYKAFHFSYAAFSFVKTRVTFNWDEERTKIVWKAHSCCGGQTYASLTLDSTA